MARVKAVRLDDRSTTMGIDRDARSYLAVLVRDDKELHAATHGVDNLIDTKRGDHQHHIAIDDLLPVVKDKIRRGDDDNIAEHDDTAQGDIAVLIDDGRHDIRTARRSVIGQSQSYSTTAEHSTDNTCHKRLVSEQMGTNEVVSRQGGERCQHHHRIDRFHTELPSQDSQGSNKQESINDEISHLHRNARTPVDYRRNTRHTARGDIVRQKEYVPPDTIGDHRYRDHQVVTQLIDNTLLFHTRDTNNVSIS